MVRNAFHQLFLCYLCETAYFRMRNEQNNIIVYDVTSFRSEAAAKCVDITLTLLASLVLTAKTQ